MYISKKPYHHRSTQIIYEIFSGVFMWSNIVLLLTHLLSGTRFNAGLQIYVLGIPLIIALIVTRKDHRLRLLLLPDSQMYNPEQF